MTDDAGKSVHEVQSVAEAVVQAMWGNGAVVTPQALREARAFIAAADALLKCRLAQQGSKPLPSAQFTPCVTVPIDTQHWPPVPSSQQSMASGLRPQEQGAFSPADVTGESTMVRQSEDDL